MAVESIQIPGDAPDEVVVICRRGTTVAFSLQRGQSLERAEELTRAALGTLGRWRDRQSEPSVSWRTVNSLWTESTSG